MDIYLGFATIDIILDEAMILFTRNLSFLVFSRCLCFTPFYCIYNIRSKDVLKKG